jgi:hypothetical protein
MPFMMFWITYRELKQLIRKPVMSIKHGSDNMAKRDGIVVKDIKNVSVGVKNMNYIIV